MNVVHKFDAAHWRKLESLERRQALPPETVFEKIRLQPGQCFVDVGAGSGYFAIPAARRVAPKGQVFAVDISKRMLEVIDGKIDGRELPIDLVHSGETKVPLKDKIADHVFTSAVFHEISVEDRSAFLNEMIRLMKSDGLLSIVDWAPVRHRTMGPPISERLDRRDVERAVRAVGLPDVRSEMIGEHFYIVYGKQ